ncbi:MAG: hypothetical protein MR320_13790 [Enterococcus gallinarum]|nr:hypothetical protein [Enterococcus gallinarum]MDY4070821.1 hypothetical protein [Enterococcus gallinarum]
MNKKKQLAYYRDKTNEISKQLSASNQKYFEDLREYLFFSSLFQDEYAVVAQVYEIANDLLEAQNHGETAEEYFGKNPKEMADELLRNTPKSRLIDQLNLIYIMVGVSWLVKLFNDFSSDSVLQLNLYSYVTTAVFSVVLVILFFFGVQKTIYLKQGFFQSKLKKFLVLWVISMVWIGGLVLLNLYTPNLFVVTLSYPMDMVLMLVLLVAACALIFLRKEKDFYPVAFMLTIFVILGILQRWASKENLTNDNRFKGLLIALLVAAFAVYILWTRRSAKDK